MRAKRVQKMEEYIYENQLVTLNQLCEEFNVSKSTVRRDIDEIVEKGNVEKVYGGVSANGHRKLIAFNERDVKNLVPKQKIAAKASELVEDGDIIFIDSGTTTKHMIDYINDKQNLTILTNNLKVITQAIPYENLNIISLSGTLNRKTLSFTGQSAVDVLQDYNICKAFMAATGVSIEKGVTNSSLLEYSIKKAVVKRSQLVCLLADSSKFGEVSLMTYCNLDQVDVLISDSTPPKDYINLFANYGHKILVTE